MNVAICEKPGLFNYIKRDKPVLEKGEAILKIKGFNDL